MSWIKASLKCVIKGHLKGIVAEPTCKHEPPIARKGCMRCGKFLDYEDNELDYDIHKSLERTQERWNKRYYREVRVSSDSNRHPQT